MIKKGLIATGTALGMFILAFILAWKTENNYSPLKSIPKSDDSDISGHTV